MAAVAKDLDQVQEEALGENGIHDMINMNKLTEDTILRNIQKRFAKNIIYTNIGAILVAMNPYQVLPIYTQKAVEAYIGKQLGALPPHIFATADAAYRAMGEMRKNQAVIISGDSGSGKTETTKLILQYLASMTQKHSEVEQMILETSPILESFGNAKTVRNNNSSRFGKFMEIHFDKDMRICGCKISQYLLEKSRIVYQAQNERNFHIFYQLCFGATDEEKSRWMLKDPSQFSYLNQSGCTEINGVDDSENFDRTRFALTLLGMNEDVQDEIFSILASVLHLGDIRFTAQGEGSKVVDMTPVETVAKLLKIDAKQLAFLLTNRNLTIRGTTTAVLLNPKLAESSRDALAKILYKRLFEWLVARINLAILKPGKQFFIGVLDIFGFENFKVNSFEQFCIDYANEKLQQHFNHALFKLEQEEYDKESINWSKIAFKDNSECIDLIEKPNPPGIISILDEESRFPKATDLTFLEKLAQKFATHNHFAKNKLSKSSFIVKHYAGDVEYQVENFLDKNKDTVTEDMLAMLVAAKVPTVQAIFKSDADEAKSQNANRRTIATQFRTNLAELMATLSSCHAFYVRCIKPNGLQQPVTFDVEMVLAQLRYTGMMDTIRIRKLGYPIRWPLYEFYRRYEILVPNSKWDSKDQRGCSNALLSKLSLTPDNWQLGKTKVFLRDKEYAALELRRNERIAKTVLIIQSWWKMMMLRMRFKQMRRSAVVIQKHFRRFRLRKRFVAQRRAIKMLQAAIRTMKVRKVQGPRLIEHRKKLEEERKKRIEEEKRRKEAAEKAAKEREEQRLKEELERRKREKEEGDRFTKEEEKRKKEAEKAAKEAEKAAEKAAKEAKKKGSKGEAGEGEPTEDDEDEVDPSWDMLRSPRGAPSGGPGSPPGSPTPTGTSPSKAETRPDRASSTLSRSLKLEQDATTGLKTLRATGMQNDGFGTMRMGTMTLRRKHGKPITTIPAAPPILQKGEEAKYTWPDFALRFFQGGSSAPKQGTATLKRGTKPSSPSEAMSYQNKPIKESLLPLKFELQKLAVQIFTKLLLYLENGPPSKPGKSDKWLCVQFVQHQGITVPDIRDEIYCQILKQTYQNTSKTDLPRSWQLLAYMIAVFLPSAGLLPYLASHVHVNSIKNDEVGQIAQYCLKRLNRSHTNKIRRQQPCSHAELDVIKRLEMMEVVIGVPGGSEYKFQLDSSTQVGEVIALLAAKREIPDPVGYAIYEVYDKAARLEQSLGVYDYIADSFGKPEVKAMVFKKKLWLHRNECPETYGEHKMISNQIREDTVDGSFPVTEQELLALTAYLLQVKLSKKKTATDPVKFDLKRHLPTSLIRKYTAEQWKTLLFAKHKEMGLENRSKRDCKKEYIQFAMKTTHYGMTYFPVETDLKANPLGYPAKCFLGVNSEGLHVCNYNDSRTVIRSFFFTEIEVWSYQYRTKLFYNDGKKQIQNEFNSTRGPELASVVKDYVFWLRLESQYAQCISDYDPGDDPNLLPMKTGDLVFITEKDEEAGWYIGECNDRAGSFPTAHVEVLITVPDTLAKMFAGAAGKQDPKAARMSFRKSNALGGDGPRDPRAAPASAVPKHMDGGGKRESGQLVSGRLSANLNAVALGPGARTDYRKSIMQRKQQYNPSNYTFEAYAKANFMNTLSISKDITFSNAPIKQPLVSGIDAPLYKNSVTTFTTIMKFMEDFPEKNKQKPGDLIRIIFEEAIDHPQLRDEIYVQLMKQTTDNGNQAHNVKGWELLAICARIFLPTEKLSPYLMAHFVNAINNKDKRPQEGALAETALSRLEVTQLGGGRTHIPSMKEIDSMLSGGSLKVDVYLSDGTRKDINIDTATIVGEVISELLRLTKLPYKNTWGLCEVISARDYDKDRALKATDNICEVINSWKGIKPPKGVDQLDFKLVYKKVIFLSEKDPDINDPRFEALIYHQCVYNIISCKQPTVEDEMVTLAGLYLQLTKSNANSAGGAKTVEDMLPDVVPTPFLLTRPKTYWVPKLLAEWQKHTDRDPRELRLAYVDRASKWPLFGCSRFAVQYSMTKKSTVDATLAITKEGLHLLEIYSKNPLKTWQFPQISSWTPTKTAFTIVTGNLVNPKREIFRTMEAEDIAVMYKAYVDSLASASIAKSRSNVVVLGS